ncbi:uncharacterized protein si:dkey-9i23.16 isoform X2 [Kryptolebias marmoratus]|nr:uncharacterized protein si:dkey-9i23.16 isoform X2 [Kryptolebias marmoratus]
MASEGAELGAGSRLYHLSKWFDIESAAVVTILLGLFQVLLSASFAYTDHSLPSLFVLPLVLGVTIIAGGSLTLANEKTPSRLLLCGCVCSNILGLLGSLLAFCIFFYTIQTDHIEEKCPDDFSYSYSICPPARLAVYSWSFTCLLLLYDTLAVIMHSLLSASAFKILKTG